MLPVLTGLCKHNICVLSVQYLDKERSRLTLHCPRILRLLHGLVD